MARWRAGITEVDLRFCCMVDENLTQQQVVPTTIFEIVAAAIKEAEKMLRETNNVYEFNAQFKRSKGLPTLLQKSDCPDRDKRNSDWAPEEYTRAKEAIEPYGSGLGRGFLAHFLPGESLPKNDTLQSTITTYYQETWRKEGDRLLEQSQLELWKGKETNDAAQIAAALDLEKQARAEAERRLQGVGSTALFGAGVGRGYNRVIRIQPPVFTPPLVMVGTIARGRIPWHLRASRRRSPLDNLDTSIAISVPFHRVYEVAPKCI